MTPKQVERWRWQQNGYHYMRPPKMRSRFSGTCIDIPYCAVRLLSYCVAPFLSYCVETGPSPARLEVRLCTSPQMASLAYSRLSEIVKIAPNAIFDPRKADVIRATNIPGQNESIARVTRRSRGEAGIRRVDADFS